MTKPSLLITRPMPEPVVTSAREICDVTVNPDNRYFRTDDIAMSLTNYDILLVTLGDTVTAAAFDGAIDCKCRMIANFGVGYNHIDIEAARKKGIIVSNTPGPVTDATADIGITLMLMTARRAGEGERLLRRGDWQGWHPTQMLGMHIGGKTLGVIGMGRIGKAIARRAHFGFGMKVVFFNRSKVQDAEVPGAVQLDSIGDVMQASDVVSVSVPGGGENRHLISADVLAAAKEGSILINTARGDVIDEVALIAALKAGTLAGAGLDVFENEPYVPEELCEMENVVLLPHIGTNALEVRTGIGLMAVENIRAFVAGKPPPNAL